MRLASLEQEQEDDASFTDTAVSRCVLSVPLRQLEAAVFLSSSLYLLPVCPTVPFPGESGCPGARGDQQEDAGPDAAGLRGRSAADLHADAQRLLPSLPVLHHLQVPPPRRPRGALTLLGPGPSLSSSQPSSLPSPNLLPVSHIIPSSSHFHLSCPHLSPTTTPFPLVFSGTETKLVGCPSAPPDKTQGALLSLLPCNWLSLLVSHFPPETDGRTDICLRPLLIYKHLFFMD